MLVLNAHISIKLLQMLEVFTLLHEFLQNLPDSERKVGIPWNSMEFQWKAIGWSLSHFGFQFHAQLPSTTYNHITQP